MTKQLSLAKQLLDQSEQSTEQPPQCGQYFQKIQKLKNHPFYLKTQSLEKIPLICEINSQNNKIINKKMKNRLKKWLEDIAIQTFDFQITTVIHSFQIIDRYLQKTNENFSQLQLIGCAALYISSKVNESKIVSGECYVLSSNLIFNIKQLQEKQLLILQTLNYNLYFNDPIKILKFFNQVFQYSTNEIKLMQKYVLKKYFDEQIRKISKIVLVSSIMTSIQNGFIQENKIERKILSLFTF